MGDRVLRERVAMTRCLPSPVFTTLFLFAHAGRSADSLHHVPKVNARHRTLGSNCRNVLGRVRP